MINVWIAILSILGFLISSYIFIKKQQKQKLICIIGQDCDKVVNGKYNKFFGIPNEIIGILYYLFIALIHLDFILVNFYTIFSIANINNFSIFLTIATFGAALYSLALIFIQAFVLREWCEYCLLSASISIIIFVLKITPLIALY